MRGVRWSRDAQADVATIDDEFDKIDQNTASRVGTSAVNAARFLADYPGAGPAVPNTRLRKWRVAGTPYILLYRLADDDLFIVRVIHVARDRQQFL